MLDGLVGDDIRFNCESAGVPGMARPALATFRGAQDLSLGLTLKGFIVSNFNHLRDDFMRDMTAWVTSGQLKYRETVLDGLEKAPEAFIGLFTGANTGKMVVNVG